MPPTDPLRRRRLRARLPVRRLPWTTSPASMGICLELLGRRRHPEQAPDPDFLLLAKRLVEIIAGDPEGTAGAVDDNVVLLCDSHFLRPDELGHAVVANLG